MNKTTYKRQQSDIFLILNNITKITIIEIDAIWRYPKR